jgi:DNA invertase Pin-like site-specific DNA recombinase
VVLIGYARISTDGQDLALQRDALRHAHCERIFEEVSSGAQSVRPELSACCAYLRAGDTLVVWRLDRLGRSLRHLIETVAELEEREIGFCSLSEGIDTTTPAGRMIFHIFGALAEFERSLIQERTRAGLEAARARGRIGGRPSVITDDTLTAARLMRAQQRPMHAIAAALGVSRATLYRHLDVDRLSLDESGTDERQGGEALIGGDQREVVSEGGRRDPQVIGRSAAAGGTQLAVAGGD